MVKWLTRSVLLVVLGALLAACTTPPQLDTIAEIAAGDDRFDTLVAALTEAELVDTFADPAAGPFTVFAPTDTAFGEYLTDSGLTAAELLALENLGDILRYHVVAGELSSVDVLAAITAGGGTAVVETLLGEDISVTLDGDDVMINGTIMVTAFDIEASNGVIHVIDYVLLPPTPQLETIAEIAAGDDRFDTLVAALTEAELVDTFADPAAGPFTVFAPTDTAFGEYLTDSGLTAAELLALENLGDILRYHVVAGELSSVDVLAAITAGGGTAVVETLLGEDISVTLDGDDVMINGTIMVTAFDIEASNGVIHVIDYVLLPPTP